MDIGQLKLVRFAVSMLTLKRRLTRFAFSIRNSESLVCHPSPLPTLLLDADGREWENQSQYVSPLAYTDNSSFDIDWQLCQDNAATKVIKISEI